MILKQRRMFFNIILLMLEDEIISDIIKNSSYSKISITTYKKMDMPGFDELVKTTALIDLTLNTDDIFSKFSDTTRNEIRKTYRNDDFVIINDDNNFDDAYRLYEKFEYAQGRVPVARNVLKKCKLFSVYFKKELISAIFITESPKYLRIRSIFSKRLQTENKEMYKIISNATRRVIWETCLWGKENGFQSLDMASVNFKNLKTANITKFKMSFGGNVVNEYTYTYKSNTLRVFEKLATARVYIKKLIYKLSH